MPVVSICIPVYKQKQYLQNCLNSVLIQDFTDYELIITDDTPDDSLEQFIKTILKDKPYHYHRNVPALGSPQNWNAAMDKAQGKYVKLLHHDDFFTQPDSLRQMVEEIEKQQASFLFCNTDVWHLSNNTHHLHAATVKQTAILKTNPGFLFFKNIIGAPSATLHLNNRLQYDKELIWLVDLDFYIRQLQHSGKIVHLNKALVSTSHEAEGQITGSVQNNRSIQIKEHVLLFNKLKPANLKPFFGFFDYLFFQYNVHTITELLQIVPEAVAHKQFFEEVISQLGKGRKWKRFKKRFFESRYNNYVFKLEQFI